MAEGNLEDYGVRNPGEVAASPALGHEECVWNSTLAVKV